MKSPYGTSEMKSLDTVKGGTMKDDEINDPALSIQDTVENYIFSDIENAFNAGVALRAFILTFQAIDFLAGYYAGGKPSIVTFSAFMNNYETLKKYSADDVYAYLNLGAPNNRTERGYILTCGRKELHLGKDRDGGTILNFESFYEDFKVAARKYIDELKSSDELKYKLEKSKQEYSALRINNESEDEDLT